MQTDRTLQQGAQTSGFGPSSLALAVGKSSLRDGCLLPQIATDFSAKNLQLLLLFTGRNQ
jgi:hypothetical protein